jgi:CRISPR-associated endoribonuclease Cas6
MTDELRLYAIVLRLAAMRPGAVPRDHGDIARAALMKIIQHGDALLAQELHDANAHKPYTISPLRGGQRGQDGALHFGDGDTAEWRFSLLCEPAFEALLRRYLLNRNLPHIRIGAVTFAIVDAFASGAGHPESGHISVAELTEQWNCPSEKLSRQLTFDFRSPTTFSRGKDELTGRYRYRAWPEPRILFSSLRKRWHELGGLAPGDEFDDWIDKWVEIELFDLRQQKVVVESRPIPCFTGQVTYRVYEDGHWLPLMNLLADLTFWTGVGYQTPRGLGQVRRLGLAAQEQSNNGS